MQFRAVLNKIAFLIRTFNRLVSSKSWHLSMSNTYFLACFAGLCHKAHIILFTQERDLKKNHTPLISPVFSTKQTIPYCWAPFSFIFISIPLLSDSPTVLGFFYCLGFHTYPTNCKDTSPSLCQISFLHVLWSLSLGKCLTPLPVKAVTFPSVDLTQT